MSNNNHYWIDKANRKGKAKEHTIDMQHRYSDAIAQSVERTVIYNPGFTAKQKLGLTIVDIQCVPMDSVTATFRYAWGKTCVLNFASYQNPGGMFLEGSKAQEECLCHESFLYNVLAQFDGSYYAWNKGHKNRALYLNRALYTPNVIFERANGEGSHSLAVDVLTCAAPNFGAASKYQNVSREENREVLRSRIEFVLSILAENNVDTAILGAYGCGVFGQDATEVAELFKEAIPKVLAGRKMNIVFAIIDGGNDNNYQKFAEVFGK